MPADSVASLVKFCSADHALRILNSQALRWSAPALFADPFELAHHSEPDFNGQTLLDALIRQVIALLFGPEPPPPGNSRLRLTIKRWREEQRFASEEEATRVLQGLLRQLAESQFRVVDHYLSEWRQFARRVRIACFSDRVTNLTAWQRFGDQHRGIALRFDCGENTSLERPRRMQYGQQVPSITQLREQLEIIFEGRQLPSVESFSDKLLVKGKHNERESEWRCFRSEDSDGDADERAWYSDHPFTTRELLGVYFGVATPRSDREDVLRVLNERYPNVRVYQGQAVNGRYELEFTPLGAR